MSDILRDFDKKNEIPKVNIPKFATGGICNDAIFPKGDYISEFEKIAKDIVKRQDNAMAMEFTKCIGELLRKNGVVPKMTEYTRNFETDNTFETRYGVSIDELDFSEHNKAFEDKIASLEKQIAYMKEKKNYLRTRCMEDATDAFDSGTYGRLTIVGRRVDLEAENEKLKKRIAELESKETEKPTKINLNDRIKVKLTPLGAEIYYHQYDEVNKKIRGNGGTELEPKMPRIDKDRFTEFQLWHFMELYGEHIGVSKPNVINPLNIIIVE